MSGAKNGPAARGGDIIEMCMEAEATRCAAFVAANAMRASDGAGVVVVAMATEDITPKGFMIFDCIHDLELVIERMRAAAKDAFADQPCTKCDA